VLDKLKTAPAQIKELELSETNAWFEVTLFEGRNQQIRKMFAAVGHSVIKLRRVAIGFLRNEKLRPGEFRPLTEAEVKRFFRLQEAPSQPPAKARKSAAPQAKS
jgi:23S rRNA pseudouridine2605 synthase